MSHPLTRPVNPPMSLPRTRRFNLHHCLHWFLLVNLLFVHLLFRHHTLHIFPLGNLPFLHRAFQRMFHRPIQVIHLPLNHLQYRPLCLPLHLVFDQLGTQHTNQHVTHLINLLIVRQ